MGTLRRLSKKKDTDPRIKPITTRVTEKEYAAFERLCNDTGFSISEAIRVLIQQEIRPEEDKVNTEEYRANTFVSNAGEGRQHKEDKPKQSEYKTLHKEVKPQPMSVGEVTDRVIAATTAKQKRASTGKFTIKHWQKAGHVPCPICEDWKTATNISRHAKTAHAIQSTKELYEGREQITTELFNTLPDPPDPQDK